MKNFYGDSIENVGEDCLLQATPFVKDTRYNFDGDLTAKIFFDHLYMEKIKSTEKDKEKARRIDTENDDFDNGINRALLCLDNKFSRADMIHISGYGGCGKTTYLRHLLWSLNKEHPYLNYIFVDFEGTDFVYEALLDSIEENLRTNFQEKVSYLNKISRGQIFKLSKFTKIENQFITVVRRLWILRNNRIDARKYDFAREIRNIKGLDSDSKTYAYLLLIINFFLLLWQGFEIEDKVSLVLVYDNVDSIDDHLQESILLSSMIEFINDCNYFINANVSGFKEYNGSLVQNVIKRTKCLFLLATRVVTIRRYVELAPDLEHVQGWYSQRMPEHYYDHFSIINKRVEYYLQNEPNSERKKKIESLKKLREISYVLYRTNSYKRLFNGNIRYCFGTLLVLNANYSNQGFIDRCIELRKQSADIRGAGVGANGLVLALLLDYFKRQGVYEEKLHLSICKKDYTVSLSRLILTFIRENKYRCSLVDLYESLSPYFSQEEFCRDIFALSESKRDVWRRLITFGLFFPASDKEFVSQVERLNSGERDKNKFSELYLCLSGMAYLDFVIPHFEYMLSRHNNPYETLSNYNYWPLFSENSLDVINEKATNEEDKYLFERKINWVYTDVSDCCDNSVCFADKVCQKMGYTRNGYLEESKLNYTASGHKDEKGMPQSYESRLIFGHVSYIERYRQYIMNQKKLEENTKSEEELGKFNKERRDINRRLVSIISKYLNLYSNNVKCYQTPRQTVAHGKLIDIVKKIEGTDYWDFDTLIELP